MTEERQTLARGLLWLGSATAAARLIDALGLVLVLRFLSREEIGVATLAWSVMVFVECFNGLGIGTATLQQPDLTPKQTASAFWYASGIGALLTAFVSFAAPWIAMAYGRPELTAMIQVSSLKLLFVGLAAVPLALVGRATRYKAMGAITTAATLVSALVTLGLAAAGFGAWAPLLGNLSNGAAQLVGGYVLAPRFSRAGFDWPQLRPMARTGVYISGSVAVVQLSRNLDYLLLGKLVGVDVLGGYRVAFDLAMAPSIAILQVGNRTALPVYSRLGKEPARLAEAWLWTLRTVLLMVLPVIILVVFDGLTVLTLLGKGGGANVELTLRLLALAAVFRGIAETFPSLYVAAGKSQLSLVHALVNLGLVAGCMVIGLWWFPSADEVLVIAFAWVAATVLLVLFSTVVVRGVVAFGARTLASVLARPALVLACTCGVLLAVQPFLPDDRRLALGVDVLVLLLTYALALRAILGLRLRALAADAPRP